MWGCMWMASASPTHRTVRSTWVSSHSRRWRACSSTTPTSSTTASRLRSMLRAPPSTCAPAGPRKTPYRCSCGVPRSPRGRPRPTPNSPKEAGVASSTANGLTHAATTPSATALSMRTPWDVAPIATYVMVASRGRCSRAASRRTSIITTPSAAVREASCAD